MKIRQGFVSNSSSSSFILNAINKTATVKQVAKLMINTIISDLIANYGIDDDYIVTRKKWLDKLDKLPDNQAVQFTSINYDTWIMKNGDYILISTCNNQSWDLPNITSCDPEKFGNLSLGDVDLESLEWGEFDIQNMHDDFYSLVYDIQGNEVGFNDYDNMYCKKKEKEYCDGYSRLWKLKKNNKIICPICDGELYKRAEKLIELKKISK